MERIDFLRMYLVTLAVLYPVLAVSYHVLTSERRLQARGYSEEYLKGLRGDRKKRIIGIAILLPLLELAAAGIVYLLTGPLHTSEQLLYCMLVFIVLVLPFPLRDHRVARATMRDLAERTGTPIAIDFDFRLLHTLFRPAWEALFSAAAVILFLSIDASFHVAFLHLALLWFLYAAVRGSRNLTRAGLEEGYSWMFVFMMLNHAVLLYHIAGMYFRCCETLPDVQAGALLVLALLQLVKMSYYAVQYSRQYRGRQLQS